MMLKNKKILIIIGGGIAAYKSLDLIRLLKKNHVEVKTILTKSGREFVTPLSLSTLTKSKTFENIFDSESESEIDHIALSRWADIILVMPTTANFMSKLSLGKAEDLATTVLLAADKDIILVPAMNVRMWLHKATQSNLKILQDFGYLFIGPEKGEMACGEFGEGKMSSPRQIFAYLKNYFDKKNIVKKKNLKAEINVVPYIDVMLVLLIIFMVLSPLLIQGVEVNLPQTDTTKMSIQNEPLVISIDKNGNYFINVGEESLIIDLDELKRKSQIIFEANPEIEVVFQSDREVAFDFVAKAMASVQSVGITKVGIVTSGYEN